MHKNWLKFFSGPAVFGLAHFVFSLVLGTMLGTLFFKILPVLPVFSNPHEIVSPLVRQNYHPVNNVIRYLIFLLCPVIVWWGLARFFRVSGADAVAAEKNEEGWWGIWVFTLCSVALVAAYVARALLFLSPDRKPFDDYAFFHEGEWLLPAFHWLQQGKLWTGTFFAHGAFYDALAPALAWRWFGVVSIGAARMIAAFQEALLFPLTTLLLVFVAAVAFSRGSRPGSAAAFFCLFASFVYLRTQEWQTWDRRDLPVILGFCTLVHGLVTGRSSAFFFCGVISVLCWINTIDRGAYYLVATIVITVAVAVLTRDVRILKRELAAFGLGLLLAGGAATFIFGLQEVHAAVITTAAHFGGKDLSDGSIYPVPGFPILNLKFLLTPHTLPLVCIALQLLAFFVFVYRRGFRLPARDGVWIAQLALLIFSAVYYRSALSRCDVVHFRYVSTFALLGAVFVVAQAFTRSWFWRFPMVKSVALGLLVLLPVQMSWVYGHAALSMLSGTPARMQEYVSLPDGAFLTDWQKETFAFLEREFRNEKCFFSLVSEPLWPYLLRKPTCGKFYLTWLLADKRLQQQAIAALLAHDPGKILVHTPLSGDEMDGIPNFERTPYLYAAVKERYELSAEFRGWEVWKRKREID